MRNLNSTDSTLLDPQLHDLLQNFTLELLHQPVTFTINGFYIINLSLLSSIAIGIVSYQILLIQFYASIWTCLVWRDVQCPSRAWKLTFMTEKKVKTFSRAPRSLRFLKHFLNNESTGWMTHRTSASFNDLSRRFHPVRLPLLRLLSNIALHLPSEFYCPTKTFTFSSGKQKFIHPTPLCILPSETIKYEKRIHCWTLIKGKQPKGVLWRNFHVESTKILVHDV